MKDAGVKIIYSPALIKVHSKIALVNKNKNGVNQSFALISTGNFNETTAQFYTDHVLMTTDKPIIKELKNLFSFLRVKDISQTNKKIQFKSLLVSRFEMNVELKKLIDAEIAKAGRGENALIRIKVNNLEEPRFINQLYVASNAGVKIELIVRSICCLIAGTPGESENIVVKRIVDRYLEHSRILIFGTGDDAIVLMGSADLMTRNLYYRIEVDVHINNERCKKELIKYFTLQWEDNDKAVRLLNGFEQVKTNPVGEEKTNAQQSIYNFLEART